MTILGVESSCDETAAAVVRDGRTVVSNVVHSQIDLHAAFGGVVPEVAARSHIEMIVPVIEKAVMEAYLNCHPELVSGSSDDVRAQAWAEIDAIACTTIPAKKFPAFVEPESSLPYSQVPATCPYPEPAPPSPCNPLPLSEDPS